MQKIKIGITIGDINGIGPEVIIKTLSHPKLLDMITPIIYGSNKVLSYHRNITKSIDFSFISIADASRAIQGKVNVVNCWEENVNITLGRPTDEGGRYAHIALDKATGELEKGMIDAIVTAPIHKKAMEGTSFQFPGLMEFFQDRFNGDQSIMLMVSEQLKVGLVTNHIPIEEIKQKITRENILSKARIFLKSMMVDFGIEKPTIAILGLNPHAGDGGKIGNEEIEMILPAIEELKKEGFLVFGPYSADGFFGSEGYKKVDGTLAMYHDQGLIPFKTISFGGGVNFTGGLSIVRTSPDHGTGYDIVGKNIANTDSMRNAIYLALDVIRNRKNDKEININPLRKKPKLTEEVEE